MTEKIKFKAANPPKIMKYNHFAHSALYSWKIFNQQANAPDLYY